MKLNDQELPDEVVAEFVRIIEQADAESLLRCVKKQDRSLLQGIRANKSNVEIIRKRILARFKRLKKLDERWIKMLGNMPGMIVTDYLDLRYFAATYRIMFALHGRAWVLSMMLLSLNEDIRKLAIEAINAKKDEDSDKSHLDAYRSNLDLMFRDLYAPFMEEEGLSPTKLLAKDTPEAPTTNGQYRVLEEKAAALERKCGEYTSEIKDLKKQVRKLESRSKKDAACAKELADLKQERDRLREALRVKTDQIEALERGLGETVMERVDRELGKRVRPWLEQPRITEEERLEFEQQWKKLDLVEMAEETLRRQAERDRHLGNRKVLSARLERLNELQERLTEAGVHALKPLPELNYLRVRIDEEANRLKELLEHEQSERPVTTDLVYQVNQCESEEALHGLYGLLEQLEERKLLPRSDFRILYDAYHRKVSRLYEQYRPNVIVPARRPPLLQMQHAFALDEPFILLLDGHNILFCLPWMFSQYYTDGCPGELARETLVSRMIELADRAPSCQVRVFFDSPQHTEQQRTANVHVQFSGGTGDHRADKAILKYLDYCCSHMSAMPRCLVTDDRELAGDARSKGAMVIKTAELATVL